jgi:CTP:molybdopterin cytidylyltransferase MocA
MCAVNVAAIILAAGSSQRLGQPKQNVLLAGETLLQRAIRTAAAAHLSPIIVVTRSAVHSSIATQTDTEFVINSNPDEGMASSIRCGTASLESKEVVGAVIMTCDQPAVTAAHLRTLRADENRITGSRYAHTIGVPAYFPRKSFAKLLQLSGDSGARTLLQAAHSISAENLELDIDTQQDLDRARALFESNPYEAS